jgi:tyrosine-specific transport protein
LEHLLNHKAIGGTLLLVGTSIGAGMLALPIALAQVGFLYSVGLAFLCWSVMYFGARFILEVNLAFKPGSHLVTMAKARLGVFGQGLAWISCLCLMYCLLLGYIAGGSDVIKSVVQQFGFHVPGFVCAIAFTFIFGLIVYAGIHFVDYANRALMFGKLGIFLLVVGVMLPKVNLLSLYGGQLTAIPGSLMILITSFGFASIVPSLRYYLQEDIPLLKRVIFWGSLIPLICYLIWIIVIMGVLPAHGPDSLMSISHMTQPLGGLILGLQKTVGVGWVERVFTLFTIICLLTAFLGVSLGLFDFIADGLHLKKRGFQGALVFAVTFFPSLLVAIFNPGIYLQALSYAGRFCVLLLLILPSLMLFRSSAETQKAAAGGKLGIVVIFLFALVLLYVGG